MNKSSKSDVVEKVTYKARLKDYTYAVLFFLLSSFFAFAVIKPVLTIAVSLQREAKDLARINAVYEKNISKLIEIQSKMELLRDKIYLIDAALPQSPKTKNLLTDISNAAQSQGIVIRTITISPLDLKSIEKTVKPVSVSIDTSSDFEKASSFIKLLLSQKRIKTIKSLKITRVADALSEGSYLRIQMTIESYYL